MASYQVRETKSGQRRYVATVRMRGITRCKTHRRKAEAVRWAVGMESEIALGNMSPFAQAERRTLGETVDRFCRERLGYNSYRVQRQRAQQLVWWCDAIGRETRLAQLVACPDLIGQCKMLLEDRGNGTINRYLGTLQRCLGVAVREWRWLPDNPLKYVSRLPEPKGRVRWLTTHERGALLFAAKGAPCRWLHAIIVLTLSTGPRKGEVSSIRWSDYDPKLHRIYLNDTKNGERRTVPLFGLSRQIMAELYAQRPARRVYVFPSDAGDYPVDIRYSWELTLQRAGIRDFHFHDLRHSAASYLAFQGATTREIQDVLGLKSAAMVGRYAHMCESVTDARVEKMNRAIFN